MKPKVSAVVPVFNTKKYLPQCLKSLLAQTLREIEIICIDDGSTDGSLEVLQEYAKKDSRIKVVSQENLGQGEARNTALKIAEGKYLAFVDSDDWIETNSFETLFDFAKKNSSQIVQFNYTEFDERDGAKKEFNFAKKTKEECGLDFDASKKYNWRDIKENCFCRLDPHSWSYFYNAEFVKQNGIRFSQSRRAEDHLFTFGAILSAEKVDYFGKAFYNYRRRKGSTTMTRSDDNFLIFENIERLKNFIVEKKLWGELEAEFEKYKKQMMVWHYSQTPLHRINEYFSICRKNLSEEDWREVKSRIKEKNADAKFFSFRKIWKKIIGA